MNQQIINSLTATLLVTAIGAAASGYAEQVRPVNQAIEAETATAESTLSVEAPQAPNQEKTFSDLALTNSEQSNSETSNLQKTNTRTVQQDPVKVGEYKTQSSDSSSSVAKVQTHTVSGRSAATLYVRNIPVITFLGTTSPIASRTDAKVGEVLDHRKSTVSQSDSASQFGSSSELRLVANSIASGSSEQSKASATDDLYKNDPVWRATTIAAALNQLIQEGVDADSIKVKWDEKRSSYLITVDGKHLVEINANTILPDTTKDSARDALQVTNRLRRLVGNAAPLKEIADQPKLAMRSVYGPISSVLQGWASWYGPGFHGNTSANGEVFNQYALTAASRTLPFGTQVRVTNLDNGRSVVVRINDRGPYAGDRILDLSLGAAQVLGMMQSGVAPVRLDILGGQ